MHACIHAYIIIHIFLCMVRTLTPRPTPFHVFSSIYICICRYVCVCLHIHISLHSLNFINGPHWDCVSTRCSLRWTYDCNWSCSNQQKSSPFRSWQNPAPLLVRLFYGVLVPPSLRGSEEERERKHRARRDPEPRRLQMGWECSLRMTKDGEQTPSMELDWTHLLLTCDYLCVYI